MNEPIAPGRPAGLDHRHRPRRDRVVNLVPRRQRGPSRSPPRMVSIGTTRANVDRAGRGHGDPPGRRAERYRRQPGQQPVSDPPLPPVPPATSRRGMSFPLPEPMRLALEEARAAALAGEVPVGAVVTRGPRGAQRGRATGCAIPATPPPMPRSSPCARRRRGFGDEPARRLRPVGDTRALAMSPGRSLWPASRASISALPIPRAAPSSTVPACSASRPATTRPKSIPASARARRARCSRRFFRERR